MKQTITSDEILMQSFISDSYCSLKPLWSGMGEVVPARTLLTLHPPSPSHCAVIILFKSVPVHQLSWLAL